MIAFKAICTGASHLEKIPPTPCQDFADFYCENSKDLNYAVVAVADGHGGEKYFRSDVGSKLAVEKALETTQEWYSGFMKGKYRISSVEHRERLSDKDFKLRQLKSSIISRWRTAVEEHFNNNPLMENESKICSTEELNPEKDMASFYGTTLLLGLLADSFVITLQIGDGICTIIDKDGKARLLTELFDEDQGFSKTNSLSSNSALDFGSDSATDKFKHIWLHGEFLGVTVASDGITDSFASDDYNGFNEKLFKEFEENPDDAQKRLDDFLPKMSQGGSRDDCAIAGAFRFASDLEEKRFWNKVKSCVGL